MQVTEDDIRDLSQTEYWGICTAIDLKNCNSEFIRSRTKISEFINALCNHIDMKKYGQPQIVHFGQDDDIAGFSMTQLIETSLLSGHFVNKTNSAFIDIFSCKKYLPNAAAEFCSNFFEAEQYKFHSYLRK